MQQWMSANLRRRVTTEEGPDVAVNANASDPHYGPTKETAAAIREGDLLLLDVWGKQKTAGSVYYDITWVGYLGAKVPEKYAKVFEVVREARDAAVDLIQKRVKAGKPLQGWQVDNAARRVVEKAGYGKYFFHRTGHNIGPCSWKRRQHGWAGNTRRAPPDSAHLQLRRTGNLSPRVRHADGSGCLRGRNGSARDRRDPDGDSRAPRLGGENEHGR